MEYLDKILSLKNILDLVISMDKRYEFFMKADLKDYVGEWVAIIGNKIVSHSKSAKKAYEDAKRKYPNRRPLLAKIPEREVMIL